MPIYTTPCFPALWQQLFRVNIHMSATPLFRPASLRRNYMYQFLGEREITTQYSPLLRKLWQRCLLPKVESLVRPLTHCWSVCGDSCLSDRPQTCQQSVCLAGIRNELSYFSVTCHLCIILSLHKFYNRKTFLPCCIKISFKVELWCSDTPDGMFQKSIEFFFTYPSGKWSL